jgi:hypothetical protein
MCILLQRKFVKTIHKWHVNFVHINFVAATYNALKIVPCIVSLYKHCLVGLDVLLIFHKHYRPIFKVHICYINQVVIRLK